jgi:hypothetical protein
METVLIRATLAVRTRMERHNRSRLRERKKASGITTSPAELKESNKPERNSESRWRQVNAIIDIESYVSLFWEPRPGL